MYNIIYIYNIYIYIYIHTYIHTYIYPSEASVNVGTSVTR